MSNPKYLSPWLPLPLAAISVVGFLAGLSRSGLVAGLAVVALVYIAWLAWSFLRMDREERSWDSKGGAVFCAVLIAVAIYDWVEVSYFVILLASVGAFVVALGLIQAASRLKTRYDRSHKLCEECGNEVASIARVCQYCGYRWAPPLRRTWP